MLASRPYERESHMSGEEAKTNTPFTSVETNADLRREKEVR
jgi:hypothetical protein